MILKTEPIVENLRKAYRSLKLSQGLSVGYNTFSEAADEIERLRAHARLLERENANLKAQQARSDAHAMHQLVRPGDAAWWQWLMADADRCASLIADAYKDWNTDESWELTLKREIDYRNFGPEINNPNHA